MVILHSYVSLPEGPKILGFPGTFACELHTLSAEAAAKLSDAKWRHFWTLFEQKHRNGFNITLFNSSYNII